jgi:apolipoprotein N-acyltransferase
LNFKQVLVYIKSMNPAFKNSLLLLSCFIGGSFFALGFPHKHIFWASFMPIIGHSIYFYGLHTFIKKGLLFSLTMSYFFLLGFSIVGFHWIPHLLLEFGGIQSPFNYLLLPFFSLIIAPQYFVYVFIYDFLHKKNLIQKISPVHHALMATLFTLLEVFSFQQFPAHIGHPLASLAPYLSYAPLFGAPIYSFIAFYLAFIISGGVSLKKVPFIDVLFITLLIIGNFLWPLKFDHKNSKGPRHTIRMVQANIGNFLKLDSENSGTSSLGKVFESYNNLSRRPGKVDLIIWPETAFPNLLDSQQLKTHPHLTPPLISQLARELDTELLIGGYDKHPTRRKGVFETEFNTAFHFGSEGQLKNVYHKKILIPFGETLPFGPFNQTLSKVIPNISFFASGENFTLFKTNKGGRFITAICYEVLFSSFIRANLNSFQKDAHFLINLTNDSWYGDTSELEQHLYLAKWRALEFNLPIVRMTNTGISTVLYPDGSESQRILHNQKRSIDLTLLAPPREKTVFQIMGTWAFVFLASFIIGIQFLFYKLTTRN